MTQELLFWIFWTVGTLLTTFIWGRYVEPDIGMDEPYYMFLSLLMAAMLWPVGLVVGLMTLAVRR